MLEQMDGSYNNPYKFNAKELDEDTGLYYYGARYYNPRLSIWYGVDPLAEKYPSWSPYAYCGTTLLITLILMEILDYQQMLRKRKEHYIQRQ
ncbi:RHS repeat-associated core domain-containing protein [Chryseobacterium arachidis]|uniref:RHS repeat-associated core domain-containing protein n=1 Tax=Chryseobacterium arachidis TaxID=1416778 RepID=A0A1M4SY88_9FLAO|nr:RHS repeat-associated core domain-containing protein [Chryseobacterium arachidis]SHE37155.1 RHS repeat-associated core domain-containing protein [Chryseobacterium arachidis]